jgi:sugar O-acyltransferase (sialic acid O-acetyltransferase NeuD family)
MKYFQILGQSNFAISILMDCLVENYPNETIKVDIIANIPTHENASLAFPFETNGVAYQEISHTDWNYKNDIPVLLGTIGRGKRAIFEFFKQNNQIEATQYQSTIHPSAIVAKMAALGHGIHISPLSVVAPYVILGNFVTLNRCVSVGHHTVLGDFVTLNPGVNVAGCCQIGESAVLGAAAVVIDSIKIGAGSIIGAGSVVTRDIPSGVIAYGNPAKVIREI